MSIHRELNATLVGRKIFVVYSAMRKPTSVIATKGRHRAQSIVVTGTEDQPAFAVINLKLHYIPVRR